MFSAIYRILLCRLHLRSKSEEISTDSVPGQAPEMEAYTMLNIRSAETPFFSPPSPAGSLINCQVLNASWYSTGSSLLGYTTTNSEWLTGKVLMFAWVPSGSSALAFTATLGVVYGRNFPQSTNGAIVLDAIVIFKKSPRETRALLPRRADSFKQHRCRICNNY